jgi:DNA-binding MarR family transcriptional regulator
VKQAYTNMLEEGDLTQSDEAILDLLCEGARTKGYITDKTGLHRNTVGTRLDRLEAGDLIRRVHRQTALYELVEDPRDG